MENMGELGKKQMDEFEALCDEFRANNVIPPDKFDTWIYMVPVSLFS